MKAMDTLHHLNAAARPEASLDDATRMINLRRDRWIDDPRAVQALEKLQWLFETPERERMPCMMLHGESDIVVGLDDGSHIERSTARQVRRLFEIAMRRNLPSPVWRLR